MFIIVLIFSVVVQCSKLCCNNVIIQSAMHKQCFAAVLDQHGCQELIFRSINPFQVHTLKQKTYMPNKSLKCE